MGIISEYFRVCTVPNWNVEWLEYMGIWKQEWPTGSGTLTSHGVYIIHDDVVNIDKLTSDILVDEKLNKLYKDGLIFW